MYAPADRGLKDEAPQNISSIVVTLEVSHALMSSLKDAAAVLQLTSCIIIIIICFKQLRHVRHRAGYPRRNVTVKPGGGGVREPAATAVLMLPLVMTLFTVGAARARRRHGRGDRRRGVARAPVAGLDVGSGLGRRRRGRRGRRQRAVATTHEDGPEDEGSGVGAGTGISVGTEVGTRDGARDGAAEGYAVGLGDGRRDGDGDGFKEGGDELGEEDGAAVAGRAVDGICEGIGDGMNEGSGEGCDVVGYGDTEGAGVG